MIKKKSLKRNLKQIYNSFYIIINFKVKTNLDKIMSIGSIAQLGERLVRIEKVTDSNSARSTIN